MVESMAESMAESFDLSHFQQAMKTIQATVVHTPLVPSFFMQKAHGIPFLMKLETVQPTGAFKLRGATHALSCLDPLGVQAVVCCSTGNHGRGIAYAAKQKGIRAVICMSSLVPQTKIDGIRALGAEVKIVGQTQEEAQAEVARLCAEEGFHEISPFDNPWVIQGQGTIGIEILEDCPNVDTILIPLSGGGLAAGVACAVKQINPKVRVIGVTMDRGAAMKQSLQAGHLVDVQEFQSLADALPGGLGHHNQYTFALCQQYLDDVVLVSEEEIYTALQTVYYEDHLIAEGSSVVGFAALQSGKISALQGPVVTVLTGRNMDMALHASIMQGRDVFLENYEIKGRAYENRAIK